MLTTSGTYPWSFVPQIFHNGQPSHGGDSNIFEMMTSILPKGTLGSVATLLASTIYQGNPDRNHTLWNVVSSDRLYTPYSGAAGMWLHINGKFTMGKFKSSLLSYSIVLNRPSQFVFYLLCEYHFITPRSKGYICYQSSSGNAK